RECRVYDGCAAERSLAVLGSCYTERRRAQARNTPIPCSSGRAPRGRVRRRSRRQVNTRRIRETVNAGSTTAAPPNAASRCSAAATSKGVAPKPATPQSPVAAVEPREAAFGGVAVAK
ncbi:hypothetical protein, partial [Pseudomonas prosekii]|uniref:hypothetical protein n=1 Tax=Pseudomonas prosekii TaxID=1148509 RepID=UPI001C639DF6